ncbi:MAG: hypothetical protein MUF81_13290 [Verrucomicrobia bacterium]|nr:hypothetical protein [Verrucomicrobiota bacterium]
MRSIHFLRILVGGITLLALLASATAAEIAPPKATPIRLLDLQCLGEPMAAYAFYCRTAVVTKEGPFAQAREFCGPHKKEYDAPVRIASRRGCMKECISGVAFTDVVLNTFFGFSHRRTAVRCSAIRKRRAPFMERSRACDSVGNFTSSPHPSMRHSHYK